MCNFGQINIPLYNNLFLIFMNIKYGLTLCQNTFIMALKIIAVMILCDVIKGIPKKQHLFLANLTSRKVTHNH